MKASTRQNLLFTLAVLALAGALFAVRQLTRPPKAAAPTALLQYGDGSQTLRVDLGEDADYDIDTGPYTVHLRVQDGAIAFVDSPCPDHLCEGFGWLREPGDWAACLPAAAMLTVEGESQ